MARLTAALVSMFNTCISAQKPMQVTLDAEPTVPEKARCLGVTRAGGPVMVLRFRSRGETHFTGYWTRD